MFVGKNSQTMTPTRTPRFEDIPSIFILHSLTKAMNTQAAAVFRLKGSLHFRLLLLKIQNTTQRNGNGAGPQISGVPAGQKGQHRAAGMRHYPAKIPR
jgi:hypothetical protein